MNTKLACVQIDVSIGNVEANRNVIVDRIRTAADSGARLRFSAPWKVQAKERVVLQSLLENLDKSRDPSIRRNGSQGLERTQSRDQ